MLRGIIQQNLWDPLRLFDGGQLGTWYSVSDLTTLFQDAAGTTPVSVDGDPVGLILDKSGNGNHASQTTTSSKPIYRTDGINHWIRFDGVDDYLSVEYGAALPQPAILSTVSDIAGGGARVVISGLTATNRHQISTDGSGDLIFFAGESIDSGVDVPVPKSIILGILDGVDSQIRINGVSVFGNAGGLSSDGLSVGALDNRNFSAFDMYDLIHVQNNVENISRLELYLSKNYSVSL